MSRAILDAKRDIYAALGRAGVPGQSPYWRNQDERLYLHPTAREEWVMAGRAGDKTRDGLIGTASEGLGGDFYIPPGERHYHTIISENVAEAQKTLRILERYLFTLNVAHTRVGDTIELSHLPRGFKVLACRVGAVSGWRCIGWFADEIAKWSDDGVDPSVEIIASVRAMTVTHPNAIGRARSSPRATVGYFYERWAAGDTADQVVGYAPTWVANPSVSEETTHKLERDPRIWAREYLAVPQAAICGAFDVDAVNRAFEPRHGDFEQAEPVLVIDPSSGMADSWSWAVVRYLRDERGRWIKRDDGSIETWPDDGSPRAHPDWKPKSPPILKFELVDGIDGKFWDQVSGDEIVRRLVAIARRAGARSVHADQRESLMLSAAFAREGLRYHKHDYTAQSKPIAVEQVRRWLRENSLWLPASGKGERLKREMLAFEEHITSTGQFTFRGRGTSHDDYVRLLTTAAIADADIGLPWSPHRKVRPFGVSKIPLPGMFPGEKWESNVNRRRSDRARAASHQQTPTRASSGGRREVRRGLSATGTRRHFRAPGAVGPGFLGCGGAPLLPSILDCNAPCGGAAPSRGPAKSNAAEEQRGPRFRARKGARKAARDTGAATAERRSGRYPKDERSDRRGPESFRG
jgi:hypothetical protein